VGDGSKRDAYECRAHIVIIVFKNMTWNKIVFIGVAALVLAAAVTVKWLFFPAIKDSYFNLNNRTLQLVPSGIVLVRSTHFSPNSRSGVSMVSVRGIGGNTMRMVGRNVSLQKIIALAYGEAEGRVLLPVLAPTNNFDFLVTVRTSPREQLQKAIRRTLGYVAYKENQDTEVLALKVKNGTLPGMTASGEDVPSGVKVKNGRLYFTHMRVQSFTGSLEHMLKLPVVDQTDLTNYYDFSTAWGTQTQRQLQNDATAQATVVKILSEWGLGLEPDTASVEMLVVKRAS